MAAEPFHKEHMAPKMAAKAARAGGAQRLHRSGLEWVAACREGPHVGDPARFGRHVPALLPQEP